MEDWIIDIENDVLDQYVNDSSLRPWILAFSGGKDSTTLDIYSHVVPGLQQAAARKIDEGLEVTPTKEQPAEVNRENVGKV